MTNLVDELINLLDLESIGKRPANPSGLASFGA